MNLKQYRIEAGLYQVRDYTIVKGHYQWQVKDDRNDTIVQEFPTLKQAIGWCLGHIALRFTVDGA